MNTTCKGCQEQTECTRFVFYSLCFVGRYLDQIERGTQMLFSLPALSDHLQNNWDGLQGKLAEQAFTEVEKGERTSNEDFLKALSEKCFHTALILVALRERQTGVEFSS